MTTRAAPDRRPRASVVRVAVFRDPAAARDLWDRLAETSRCSPYQTRAWLTPWLETIGAAMEPVLVAAYGEGDDPLAFLLLGVVRRNGLRVASFLGGKDSNCGLGLFDQAFAFESETIRDLLRKAARLAGIDLFVLRNQPWQWDDCPNPLATLPFARSASDQHKASLVQPAERYFDATLSKASRKHLRQKEKKLAALGPVHHEIARTPEALDAAVGAYLRQKNARFRQLGISDGRDDESLRGFLLKACRTGGDGAPPVEIHTLTCGEAIVATFAGAAHQGRFAGMLASFASDEDMARFSPGEILIAKVIAAKCDDGLRAFDLGIGEARYKAMFCPEPEPLFDSILGMTLAGRIAAPVVSAGLAAKRLVKRTPWLWRGLRAARRPRNAVSRRGALRRIF